MKLTPHRRSETQPPTRLFTNSQLPCNLILKRGILVWRFVSSSLNVSRVFDTCQSYRQRPVLGVVTHSDDPIAVTGDSLNADQASKLCSRLMLGMLGCKTLLLSFIQPCIIASIVPGHQEI